MPNAFPRWAAKEINLPEGRTWRFEDRPWLLQIYQAFDPLTTKELYLLKSSQGGISTFALAASFYLAIEIGGVNIGYYLPRQDDVSDIVETKVDIMLEGKSPLASHLSRPSSVRTKKLLPGGDGKPASFIRFAEASIPPRILTLDMVVKDEFDLCNPTYLAQASSRMDSSAYAIELSLGVPYSTGLYSLFENRSQACEWFIPCSHCGHRQFLTWEENVQIQDGLALYICKECGCEITTEDRLKGEWVAAHPHRSAQGFHVTQLMYAWRSAQDLFDESLRLRKADFYALKLAQIAEEGQGLSEEKLLGLLFGPQPFEAEQTHEEGWTYYMGVDQGDLVYVVVAKRNQESSEVRIVFLSILPLEKAENEIANLMAAFQVQEMGIDAEPNKLLGLNLHKQGLPVWCITQSTRLSKPLEVNREAGEITLQRDISFDDLFGSELRGGNWYLFGRPPLSIEVMDPLRRQFIHHLVALKRLPGSPRLSRKGLWQTKGQDHFAHALSFLLTVMNLRRQGPRRFATISHFTVLEKERILAQKRREELTLGQETKDQDGKNPLPRQSNPKGPRRGSTRLAKAIGQIRANSNRRSWPTFPTA